MWDLGAPAFSAAHLYAAGPNKSLSWQTICELYKKPLMSTETSVVRRYENGCTVSRILEGNDRYPVGHIVQTGEGKEIVFKSPAWRAARTFGALDALYGPFRHAVNSDVVPVEIATAGMPAITAYLYCFHQRRQPLRNAKRSLADRLEVQPETISKYLKRVRDDARPLIVD